MNVQVKRVYEPPAANDGTRVLVDRIWPRGVRKADAAVDLWLKDVAPSSELRRWFGHDPARWGDFKVRYRTELRQRREAMSELERLARQGPLTLVYGARDTEHNNAVALREILAGRQ